VGLFHEFVGRLLLGAEVYEFAGFHIQVLFLLLCNIQFFIELLR